MISFAESRRFIQQLPSLSTTKLESILQDLYELNRAKNITRPQETLIPEIEKELDKRQNIGNPD